MTKLLGVLLVVISIALFYNTFYILEHCEGRYCFPNGMMSLILTFVFLLFGIVFILRNTDNE